MPHDNVVLMHCHDLGRHLHALGATTVVSPNLDAFAEEGVTLASMFATAPQCSPSRASLFTGRWPHANGVMGLTHSRFGWDLRPGETHLARHLSAAGYTTEAIGVVHEARTQTDDLASRLGFDHLHTPRALADEVATAAAEAIDRLGAADQPFYLQIGFLEPHRIPGDRDAEGTMGFLGNHLEPDTERGVDVPAYLVDSPDARTELAELQGAIRFLDAAVGRILAAIHAAGLDQDTLVIFTTDHGLALPRAKCSLYDPGIEIACLLRFPGRGWVGGRTESELCSNLDLTPTILAAVGVAPLAAAPEIQGRSLAPLLDGVAARDDDDQVVFAEITYHDYYDPRRCVRTSRWKLIANFSSAPGFMDSSQSWRRRCVPRPEVQWNWDMYHPAVELYDLQSDPLELTDLAGEDAYTDVVADLGSRLARWMAETEDPLRHGAVTNPLHLTALATIESGTVTGPALVDLDAAAQLV